MTMFLLTANGTSLLIGSIVNIEATDARHIPASESATRPDGAAVCILVDALRGVRTDYDTEQLSAQIDRHVLGWFATQADADRALETYQRNTASNPFSFAADHAFRYEP
jgi:hypothetical protein